MGGGGRGGGRGRGPPPGVACPSGESTQFQPINIFSPTFILQTHKGATIDNDVNCTMDYVMGDCSEATLSCYVDMIGEGDSCEEGDRVSIITANETIHLCGDNKEANITKVGGGLV